MKQEKTKAKEKAKKSSRLLPKIVVSALMLIGLGLILYPTLVNMYNNVRNERAIHDYQRQVESLGESECQRMLAEVQAYNENLARHMPYIGELTAAQREEYESLLDVTGTGLIGYIEIEKSDIFLGVYHGTAESVLQIAVGHLEASSLPVPGKSVHTVLTGHSGLPSARLFTDLDKLGVGDTFTLHVLDQTLTYRVENIYRTSPEELGDMQIEEGQELCTLITCTPYGVNTHRLVVTARRIETPADDAQSASAAEKILMSTWNRWFLFLPAAIGAGIVVLAVMVHRRKKAKQKTEDLSHT